MTTRDTFKKCLNLDRVFVLHLYALFIYPTKNVSFTYEFHDVKGASIDHGSQDKHHLLRHDDKNMIPSIFYVPVICLVVHGDNLGRNHHLLYALEVLRFLSYKRVSYLRHRVKMTAVD